jgi:hypothetical protein
MLDQITRTTTKSFGSRLGSSIGGILFGFLFVAGSIYLLSWNENRAVTTARSLAEGEKTVVSLPAATVDSANEGKLIHLSGEATTSEPLSDPIFGVSVTALRLGRVVNMYQWKEDKEETTTKRSDGSTEKKTTYRYTKAWAGSRIDSSKFQQPEGHQNPPSLPVSADSFVAPNAMLGSFKLPARLLAKMKGDRPLVPTAGDLEKVPAPWNPKLHVFESGFYHGVDPVNPANGDLKITFQMLPPGPFSILAQQQGETLAPYPTMAGREIERVENGLVSAALMFQHAHSENNLLTWLLRGAGGLAMALGFRMVLSPISTLGSAIPIFGRILQTGVGFVATILAAAGSLVTIAVAWVAVRPAFGITLVVLAVGALFLPRLLRARRDPSVPPPIDGPIG